MSSINRAESPEPEQLNPESAPPSGYTEPEVGEHRVYVGESLFTPVQEVRPELSSRTRGILRVAEVCVSAVVKPAAFICLTFWPLTWLFYFYAFGLGLYVLLGWGIAWTISAVSDAIRPEWKATSRFAAVTAEVRSWEAWSYVAARHSEYQQKKERRRAHSEQRPVSEQEREQTQEEPSYVERALVLHAGWDQRKEMGLEFTQREMDFVRRQDLRRRRRPEPSPHADPPRLQVIKSTRCNGLIHEYRNAA